MTQGSSFLGESYSNGDKELQSNLKEKDASIFTLITPVISLVKWNKQSFSSIEIHKIHKELSAPVHSLVHQIQV